MNMSIRFPHLGISLPQVGKTITVFGFDIAYYGIVIAIAMIVGISIAMREARRTGQDPDIYLDMLMITMVTSVIGARIYYVAFSWENYKDDLIQIFNTRNGGLAIYGGIIAGIITVYVFVKIKKMNFQQVADTVCMGLITGQIIGRWGNFFNTFVYQFRNLRMAVIQIICSLCSFPYRQFVRMRSLQLCGSIWWKSMEWNIFRYILHSFMKDFGILWFFSFCSGTETERNFRENYFCVI